MGVANKTQRSRFSKVFGTDLKDSIWALHEWNLDIRNFSIYLVGEAKDYGNDSKLSEPGVEYQMASRLIKNLQILATLDPVRVILIHMKTCGGSWEEGMAIYDAIKAVPNKVVILNYTHARSMSSVILQAADKRVMMPHSHFMFHDGALEVSGTYKSVITNVAWAEKEKPIMEDVYINRMKERGRYRRWSRDSIRTMLREQMDKKEDVFLSAIQAVDWGLADSIFDGNWDQLRKRFPRVIIAKKT